MWRLLKMVLCLLAALFALAIGLFVYSGYKDQQNFRAAKNPCERACIQDSGGLEDCRKHCASHPLTYGPAVPAPSH